MQGTCLTAIFHGTLLGLLAVFMQASGVPASGICLLTGLVSTALMTIFILLYNPPQEEQ